MPPIFMLLIICFLCFFAGFGMSMYFCRQMLKEATQKYEHATTRWDAGTNEYRKAAEKLKEYLKNIDENDKKIKTNIQNVLKDLRKSLEGHVPDEVLDVISKKNVP